MNAAPTSTITSAITTAHLFSVGAARV